MKKHEIFEFVKALDDKELSSLQIAVLLGDHFSVDHILSVSDIKPSKFLYLFDRLIRANIIKKINNAASVTYSFCNTTFPNIIFKSINEEKKIEYCSLLIDCLEGEPVKDIDSIHALANLYLQFRETKKRFQYIKKAADFLISAHHTEEGLVLYKEIIDALLEKTRDQIETVILIDSIISYAPSAIHLKPPDNILQIVNKAILLADELDNKRARVMLGICLGSIYRKQGKYLEASLYYDMGWSLAQEIKDEGLLKKAAKLYALSLFWQGRIKEAIQIYEDTLGNLEEITPELKGLWAHLMLAWSYGIVGRIGRGVGLVEAIRKIALSKGDLKAQAFAHGTISLILLEARMVDQAEPHIAAAIEIGEKIGSDTALFMAKPCKAYIKMTRGNLKEAKELWESLSELQEKVGPEGYIISAALELHIALQNKWSTVGGDSLSLRMERSLNSHNLYFKGVALRYQAIMKRDQGKVEQIEMILRESLELLNQSGANIERARTQIELAKFYLGKKDIQKAKEFAALAYDTLSEINIALYPPDLNFLVEEKTKDVRWDHGVSELEAAIQFIPHFDKYLGKVVEVLANMFGAERAAILLMKESESSEDLHVAALRNFSSEDVGIFGTDVIQSLISSTISKSKPLIISGHEDHRVLLQLSDEKILIKSLALIPLISANKAIGVIYMDNRLLEEVFSSQDITIMTAIATQVSLASKVSVLFNQSDGLKGVNEGINSSPTKREALRDDFPQVIGKSKTINEVLLNAKKVAQTNATVLIYGETGVGKELIANAIHQLSHRKNRPFIPVNISALNENLTTSELFGYEKGAYTGAIRTNPGRFEMANGGTIFLDEIAELSLDTQVKLLRVLQDHKFERVGSNKTISSDFRLIVATNKNLRQKVATGEFRSDLFFRISSFPIEVPPLRERKEDISLLAYYFLANHSRVNKKNIKRITTSEMKKLLEYSWPGNVRELDNVIEKAVILSEDDSLTIPLFEPSSPIIEDERDDFGLLPLCEIERKHIINILNHTKWKIRGESGAAKILGLKPTTLEFRIKKLGIS